MKKSIFLPFILLLVVVHDGLSQAPVPDPDTVGVPIQQGDPAIEAMPRDLDYVDDKKKISTDELPEAVRKTLDSGTRYSNWKEAAIFHDRNQDEYIVQFTYAGNTTTYRFTKEGKPIVQKE